RTDYRDEGGPPRHIFLGLKKPFGKTKIETLDYDGICLAVVIFLSCGATAFVLAAQNRRTR
ncbi:MAG: hypothetical protein JWO82_3687, partial [Akkermansiaceae bacterium]|nr:hypothetical protein [Akkermansiaceae bacterium]